MSSMQFTMLPPPQILENDIECLRMIEHSGEEGLAINVFPSGVPGMVFHQNNGRAAIEQIITHSGRESRVPPLFLYGPGTEPSVMRYKRGLSTTIRFCQNSNSILLRGSRFVLLIPSENGTRSMANELSCAGYMGYPF